MTAGKNVAHHVARLLDWEHAHAGFDTAIADLPLELRGVQPQGLPYSPWQLLEHLRLSQRDILDYCRDADYRERRWPQDYWPGDPAPPAPDAWDQSVAAFRKDLRDLKQLATDPTVDLLSPVPNDGQVTYLRELLLVADHNAYHIGQLVAVRRLLNAWRDES